MIQKPGFQILDEMDTKTRPATAEDIPHLINFRLVAQDGINEALFEGLEMPVEEIIRNEMMNADSFESFHNYWVAEIGGETAGGMQVFLFDLLEEPYNPLIPEERLEIEKPFEELMAPGSFYIHALTVYPQFARRGIASELVRLANQLASDRGFSELSLYCFDENLPAVRLYQKHGFTAIDRRPIVALPQLNEPGNILLMTCPVHP